MEYAFTGDREGLRTARARLTGLNASFKDLCEVCRNVRGMMTSDALEFLSLAYEKKVPIYFARHNKRMAHRRELGGRKGGWPVKSVKYVLEAVKSANANAVSAGLGNTKVLHILANKRDTHARLSPKGRRMRADYETAFVEVVLLEVQEKQDRLSGKEKGGKKKGKKGSKVKKAENVNVVKVSESGERLPTEVAAKPEKGKALEKNGNAEKSIEKPETVQKPKAIEKNEKAGKENGSGKPPKEEAAKGKDALNENKKDGVKKADDMKKGEPPQKDTLKGDGKKKGDGAEKNQDKSV